MGVIITTIRHGTGLAICILYSITVQSNGLFNSTLHAGEAKANIILAMAISAQGINQKYTQFRKTPIGDNPAFTFRTFLLRLGLIGPEYKMCGCTAKESSGDKAWRYDKSLYPATKQGPALTSPDRRRNVPKRIFCLWFQSEF